MTDLYYEMQALTWRAKPPIQQDAILIGNKVIQHDGLISKHYIYNNDCIVLEFANRGICKEMEVCSIGFMVIDMPFFP